MIRDNFYPDASTHLTTGEKFTAYVPSIPITTEQAPSAYWLGWISKDNLPQAFRHSEISLNNNGYQFSDITPDDNFDCGYNFRFPANHTYYADTPFRMVRYQTGVSKWQANEGNQNSNNFCFGNYINCMCDAISKVEIYVRYTIYDSEDAVVRRSMGYSAVLLKNFSFEDFVAFLNGGTITISFGEQGDVDITKQDLETGYCIKESSLGYNVELFINAYKFIHTRSVNSNSTTETGSTSKSSCFMAHINTEKYGDTIISGDDTGQGSVMQWDKRYPTQILDKILIWGMNGYFSFNDIDSLSWNGKRHIYNGNVLIFKPENTYILYVAAIFPIGEIEKHFNLCMRMSKAHFTSFDPYVPYYGYIENDVYAPYITGDNEFTATRITGNLEDPEFLDKLRPWQYDVTKWEDNDYKEEDRPPYVPPTPTDEEQTDGIDWMPNRAFAVDSIDGFVTMYGLRGDQIGRFGQYLWAEFWSEDFLNSIGVIFNQNLSINPSEILNYIVSVRCYPFSLSGRAGASSISDTIYLGRGGEGISLNSGHDILKLTSYTEDIDGGISVWEGGNAIPAYYNDFRDYEPCSKITVFVPFCGSLELPPSQVVGNKIHLRYSIDFSSGAMQATISVEGKNNYIAGILTGTIGASVELSASNLGQVIQKIGGLAINAAKSAALLSIGATEANAAMAYDDAGIDALLAETSAKGALTQGVISTAETITSVGNMSTGAPASFGTTAGFSAFQVTTPIIRVEYRHYEIPSNYAHVYGYACNKTVTLSELEGKGFTVCKNVDLEGIPATQDELSAIESLLTSGVYF